jgi:hypothetical protein
LLSVAGSAGGTDDVTVRFHDPPTGIGSVGPAAAGSLPVAGGSTAGERCGLRKSMVGSGSSGTSVVAMSPKMEIPSSAGSALCPGMAASGASASSASSASSGAGASSPPECAYLIGSSTPECADLIGPSRRLALRSCRGDRASWTGFSATAYVVPMTPVF